MPDDLQQTSDPLQNIRKFYFQWRGVKPNEKVGANRSDPVQNAFLAKHFVPRWQWQA